MQQLWFIKENTDIILIRKLQLVQQILDIVVHSIFKLKTPFYFKLYV